VVVVVVERERRKKSGSFFSFFQRTEGSRTIFLLPVQRIIQLAIFCEKPAFLA
jgi:hypothetical protein